MEYSDENIKKLVNDWFNHENSDVILEIFKNICSGPKSLDAFTSAFHPEEYVAGLLENTEVLKKLKSHHREAIVSSILSFHHLRLRWAKILIGIIDCDKELIGRILSHEDAESFPVDLIETCLSKDCSYFEKIVLKAYDEKSPEILNRWEIWSANSPNLFRMFSSVLNELLFVLKDKKYVYELIERFVAKVKNWCDSSGSDFVNLYPEKVQNIVVYILLYEKSEDEHLEKIISSYFCNINYRLSVILLTHFKVVQRFVRI